MKYNNFRALSLVIFFFAIGGGAVSAQDAYTVQAGVFRDVKGKDFATIQDLGYVHSFPAGGKEVEVFVGQFTDQALATSVARTLNQRGFLNARVMNLPVGAGQSLIMVQFALHGVGKPIPWKAYDELGALHVQSLDGTLKVFTGPYATTDEAKRALSPIKAAGYGDAFVKSVSSLRLIPIDVFETGLKKPLIPINLPPRGATSGTTVRPTAPNTGPAKEAEPVSASPRTYSTASPVPQPTVVAPSGISASDSPVSAPDSPKAEVIAPPAAAAPPALPAATSDAKLPAFDGSEKRHSTAELQSVLKAKGFYSGSIDGLYGPGTTAAYEKAWNALPEIRKYRLLSGASFASVDPDRNAVTQWPEVAVLMAITEELSAGKTDAERARVMAGQRNALLTTKERLNTVATTRTKDWAASLWENLNEWATEDPLHDEVITALRISYHQTQSRLEQYYSNAGFGPIEARDLAIAMMQNLTGAQLDRFL